MVNKRNLYQKGFISAGLIGSLIAILLFGAAFYFLKSNVSQDKNNQVNNIQEEPSKPKSEFSWNKQSKQAVFKRNGVIAMSFQLEETPKKVWANKEGSSLGIVTKSADKSKNTNNLFVYNGEKLIQVYKGGVLGGPPALKDSPDNFRGEGFSPDGKYFLVNITNYEFSSPLIVATSQGIVQEDKEFNVSPFYSVFWSSDSKCFLNVLGVGMFGPAFVLGREEAERIVRFKLKKPEEPLSFFDNKNTKVFWGNNCSGIIYLEGEGEKRFYQFDLASKKLIKSEQTDISKYKKSITRDQEEVLIKEL